MTACGICKKDPGRCKCPVEEENVPKDLGIKIGTKKEAEYTRLLRTQEEAILKEEVNLEINKIVRDFCKKRISEEEKSRS
jgi:hypothetical protein